MGTVLFTWELGGGLGHLARMLPLAKGLRERGHRVVLALRELSRAARFFAGLGVEVFQAPIKTWPTRPPLGEPRSFAHVLYNSGFAKADELQGLADAWRSLLAAVKPDLILFDHSPAALLAAQGIPARRAVLGTGFCCPADAAPLPDLRTWLPPDTAQLQADEQRVLDNANVVLAAWGCAPLARIAELHARVDETFLTTFAELDPYVPRGNAEYWGTWSLDGGEPPVWPAGGGRRIVAYLKPFPALPQLLGLLKRLNEATLVYLDNLDGKLAAEFGSPRLRFVEKPLDMRRAAAECDLAILHGTHGAAAAMLMAGKPALHIPIYLEQALTALAVSRLGAGTGAARNEPHRFGDGLARLLNCPSYAEAAWRFAAKYAGFDGQDPIARMIDRCDRLLRA